MVAQREYLCGMAEMTVRSRLVEQVIQSTAGLPAARRAAGSSPGTALGSTTCAGYGAAATRTWPPAPTARANAT